MSGRSPGVSSRYRLGLLLDHVVFAVVLFGFVFSSLNWFSNLGVSSFVLGKGEAPLIEGSIAVKLGSYSVKIHQIWSVVEELLGFELMCLSLGGLKGFDWGLLMLVCAFGSVIERFLLLEPDSVRLKKKKEIKVSCDVSLRDLVGDGNETGCNTLCWGSAGDWFCSERFIIGIGRLGVKGMALNLRESHIGAFDGGRIGVQAEYQWSATVSRLVRVFEIGFLVWYTGKLVNLLVSRKEDFFFLWWQGEELRILLVVIIWSSGIFLFPFSEGVKCIVFGQIWTSGKCISDLGIGSSCLIAGESYLRQRLLFFLYSQRSDGLEKATSFFWQYWIINWLQIWEVFTLTGEDRWFNEDCKDLLLFGKLWSYKKRRELAPNKHHSHKLFSSFSRYLFSEFLFFSLESEFVHWSWGLSMSQSGFLGKSTVGSMVNGKAPKRRIKLSPLDNSALIAGYSKTLIGRCMNPSKQEMKTLLFMLPRIWQLEGRVAGADLGLGRFQFDFEAEEDIVEVLKMEPLHFDHWMVSLVRWAPSVDPNYPSAITFWIRVLGVPIEYWADQTFREIGEDLGKVEAVDIVGGRIQVTVDGFKPLCFETEIEFGNGEETVMFFQYERLFGFCELCFSLCHDKSVCALNPVTGSGKQLSMAEVITDSLVQSYRGAVSQVARHELNQGGKVSHGSKGKSSMEVGNDVKNQNLSGNNKGALVPQPRQFASYIQLNEHRFSKAGGYGSKRHQTQGMGKTLSESQGQSSKAAVFFQPKQVRKALFSSQETHGDDAAGTAMEVGLEEDSGKGKEIGLNGLNLVEVAGPASVENSVTVTESSLPLKSGAGLNEDGDAEFQKEVSTLMSTDEVDGDDLMDGTVLVSSSCPLDESHDHTMEDTTSEQMADDEDVEESDHSDMVAAKAEATEADTERSQKQKGPLLLKGVSSKKRNAQLFTSPRKRNAAKGGDQGKEGNNPTYHGTVKGVPGGGKPPKPKVDK